MRISTTFTIIAVISIMFTIFALMINEANDNYGSQGVSINATEWEDKYDYVDTLNQTVSPLQDAFDDIQDPDKGWFSKVVSGIAAVPYAITLIPSLVFQNFGTVGSLLTGLSTTANIPAFILLGFIVMILIWGIFKLVEMYNRWPI